MKKLIVLSFVILALTITSCNIPLDDVTEEPEDILATEIAIELTKMVAEETPTLAEFTPTLEPTPTDSPEPDDTPTPEPTDTPTLAPTPTPEPTDTPTIVPTPTLVDSDPTVNLGPADWTDNMATGGHWATGFNPISDIRFEDGYLKLTSTSDLIGWRLSWPELDDFYLESTVLSPNCSGWDEFGMVFRAPESTGAEKVYLFGITCNGRYSLRRWDGKTMHVIINWTQNTNIQTGVNNINRLGVMAQGANLGLYINGQLVNETVDDAYLSGQFGVFVGGRDVEDVEMWMGQIRYWENP